MVETNITNPNLVSPPDAIRRFREECNEIADKLHKDPERLKEEMAALSILVYEAYVRGDNKFLITFNEKGLPDIKGYKQNFFQKQNP